MSVWYGLPYKIGNDDFLSLLLIDDNIYTSLTTNNTTVAISDYESDYLAALTPIDNYFGSTTWQAGKYPLYAPLSIQSNLFNDVVGTMPTNAFTLDTSARSGAILDSAGTTRNNLFNTHNTTYGGYIYYTGSYTAENNLPIHTAANGNNNVATIYFYVYVGSSEAIANDKIVDATKIKQIQISITKYNTGQYINVYYAVAMYTRAISNTTWNNAPLGGAIITPTDPYDGAGDSDTGGGDGTFDGTSDPVPVPSLPSVGATDSGFITLFAPTVSQLKDLAHYMWINPLFDVETGFKKLFSDPMDCILGLSVVPVAIPTAGAQNVNIGNLVTSVSMNVASKQYIEVDCGSISFANKFFGSYLDYEPYTKMSIFVPYSGIHSLCADDIMGKTVQLIYHIDILTGSLVAFLKCGDSVLYEFNGACGSNIPVNSLNYASTIENAIRIAVNIGTTVATAGAAAPAAMGAEAVGGAMTARNIATGINLAGSTAEGSLSLKPNIDRAGSLGGTTGLLGNQTPYIIITRPRLCKPKDQNKIKGYPSFITCTLGDLDGKGYTEIDTVILNNIYLTDAEKDELIGVLKGGVYL